MPSIPLTLIFGLYPSQVRKFYKTETADARG